MIVVIADDLSGAAEIAGIGLRYNMVVELSVNTYPSSVTELFVVATDTRSMTEEDAVAEVRRITIEVMLLKPDFIYKKIDSVLRGHIIAELKVQMEILNFPMALIVAPNTFLGRTIRDGKYYINDSLIHFSSFAKDPEFAIKSSDVVDMLRADRSFVQVKKPGEEIHKEGIIIGEVSNMKDLAHWASQLQPRTLPAGSSGFFTAILESMNPEFEKIYLKDEFDGLTPALFVCGSAFQASQEMIRELKNSGGPVIYMPLKKLTNKWLVEIRFILEEHGKAVIAIDPQTVQASGLSAASLREQMSIVVEEVFNNADIYELYIEGGSTAAAVIRRLGLKKFLPIEELAPGVVRMKSQDREGLFLTVKPGSYQWPESVWRFD